MREELAASPGLVVGFYAGLDGVANDESELALGRVWKIGSVGQLFLKLVHEMTQRDIAAAG
jgi:hypothetical protein